MKNDVKEIKVKKKKGVKEVKVRLERKRVAPDVPWIKDGKCINKGESICNLGLACDGCPWNFDEEEKSRPERICCSCKKPKKIVNCGGPPLCEDCLPLALNILSAVDSQNKFFKEVAGIYTEEFETGIDDVDYHLNLMSEDLAEAKMKIKQTEVCMLNIQSAIHIDRDWEPRKKEKHDPPLKCFRCGKTEGEQEMGFVSVYGFCDKCHEEFIPCLRQLRLAFIHHYLHPEKKTIWVNDDSTKVPMPETNSVVSKRKK